MITEVSFVLDGKVETVDFNADPSIAPTTTVLEYLRSLPNHKGVKEGCAEGDCGACTVVLGELGAGDVIRYKSFDSCLTFLPKLHGKVLVTVENLKDDSGELHPVQQAMVQTGGSQCGFCTPGIVMSLFSLYKNADHPGRPEIDEALTGNLCRCTGYRPIVEAASTACVRNGMDHFSSEDAHTATLLKSIPVGSLAIVTHRQKYFRPASLGEFFSLRASHPQASLISGGTDVALRVTKKHELINEIIDLSGVDELRRIAATGEGLTLGAGVTLNEAMPHLEKDFPAMVSMFNVFASQQIRNAATLGGNLGTASPIGDSPPVLMAYGASVVAASKSGNRTIPLDRFFTGYRKTELRPDEILVSVSIPYLLNGSMVRSYKVSKRKDLDIATLSGGFKLDSEADGTVKHIVLAYGGMAATPKRARNAEAFLLGKRWTRENVEAAMPLIDKDFSPISDVRGSAEFRSLAAKNLLLKFWTDTSD